MKRVVLTSLLIVALAGVPYAVASTKMWSCAPPGQRGNALVLVDRGAQSYVKFSGQRVNAQHTTEDAGQRWSWGSNAVVLTDDLIAQYYEGDTAKARFKCKRLGAK